MRYSRIAEVYTAAFAPMRTLYCVRCLRYLWIRPTGNYSARVKPDCQYSSWWEAVVALARSSLGVHAEGQGRTYLQASFLTTRLERALLRRCGCVRRGWSHVGSLRLSSSLLRGRHLGCSNLSRGCGGVCRISISVRRAVVHQETTSSLAVCTLYAVQVERVDRAKRAQEAFVDAPVVARSALGRLKRGGGKRRGRERESG